MTTSEYKSNVDTTQRGLTDPNGYCKAEHPNAPDGCYGSTKHTGLHFDDVNFAEASPFVWGEALSIEEQRAELIALSYEGAHDPLNKSPYPRRAFRELPQWQKDWHERVADLVLKAGFRKEV